MEKLNHLWAFFMNDIMGMAWLRNILAEIGLKPENAGYQVIVTVLEIAFLIFVLWAIVMLSRLILPRKRARVAFVCTRNTCLSQIAEALGKKYSLKVYQSYSAGKKPEKKLDEKTVRLMKDMYGIDISKSQRSKLISDIPDPYVVVYMESGVTYPYIPHKIEKRWEFHDPCGKADEVYIKTIKEIEKKILELNEEAKNWKR